MEENQDSHSYGVHRPQTFWLDFYDIVTLLLVMGLVFNAHLILWYLLTGFALIIAGYRHFSNHYQTNHPHI